MGGVSSSRTNPIDSYKSNSSLGSPIPGNSQDHNSSTTSSNLPLSSDFSAATETPEASDQSKKPIDANGDEGQEVEEEEEEEEEEEGECGFCVYMKGGGCKDAFIGWEDCVKEAEDSNEDIVEKCREVTRSLTKCMEAHADYYEPILKAEKAAKEEAVNELKVKAAKESESNVAEKEAVIVVDLTDQEAMKGSGDHK